MTEDPTPTRNTSSLTTPTSSPLTHPQLPPHPPPLSLSSPTQNDMPLSTGKRRTNTSIMNSSSNTSDLPLLKQNFPDERNSSAVSANIGVAVTKRRRFILYTLAFAVMLAMSSVLDVRRAALRNRHAKLQLTLPSASLSSLSDEHEHDAIDPSLDFSSSSSNDEDQQQLQHQEQPDIVSAPVTHPPPVAALDTFPHQPPIGPVDNDSGTAPSTKHDYKLSQQELDDNVDQLIAHVDQEAAASASNNGTSLTTTAVIDTNLSTLKHTDDTLKSNTSSTSDKNKPSKQQTSNDTKSSSTFTPDSSTSISNTVTENSTLTTAEDIKLNAEDTFHAAVQRLSSFIKEDKSAQYLDEHDLRTLQALELQATRGDCELKSGASLFKTDAEAASNVDIERTHPLWGAWCLFMGSYKSDAMRDYVTKELVVEQKLSSLKNQTNLLSPTTNDQLPSFYNDSKFDAIKASLDDVMPSEQQKNLKKQTEMVVAHLQENDLRHLVSLSFQATFGDCGPYGRELLNLETSIKEHVNGDSGIVEKEKVAELRILKEPLFEVTVTRRKGALWGAWCVMQGKKRSAAAANLSQRVELLVEQLTRSQEASGDHAEDDRDEVDLDGEERIDNVARVLRLDEEKA